jgi:hypothetical protein
MNRCRVFISYSHRDADLAKRIEAHLRRQKVAVLWDENFEYGRGFHEQIKTFIAYAHVFLPIITQDSRARGWVHQEIGYAIALNVPVLPIAVGITPGEMLEGLQAIWLEDRDATLAGKLTFAVLDQLIQRQDDPAKALYVCAEEAEHRAVMMRQHSEEVLRLHQAGRVRQRGALSSFHIPTQTTLHRVWKDRYDGKPRSAFYCELQRQERLSLERHARTSGCKLIICPEVTYDEYGPLARITRLQGLIDFLKAMPDDKVEIARGPKLEQGENLTVVGDWFSASSLSGAPTKGYRQTIFTRHAPTVRAHIQLFDAAFEEAMQARPWTAKSSRLGAIGMLSRLVAKLRRQIARR